MARHQPENLYIAERSDSYMCFPACLNMIFKRRDLKIFPQQQIAYSLGLKIPLYMKEKYPNAQISDIESEYGVHPNNENSLEQFINRNGIELKLKYINLKDIPSNSIIDCLCDNLETGNDIIVGYDYATVFQDGLHVGHVSLICSVDELKNTVVLMDPEEYQPIEVDIRKLLAGILKRSSGFWIFSSLGETISVNYL